GDTMIVAEQGHLGSSGGTGLYVHLAGIDAPELNQPGGPNSAQYLARLVLNQFVSITIAKQYNDHAIVTMRLGQSGYGKDVGSVMLENGWAFYRAQDTNYLPSSNRANYDS